MCSSRCAVPAKCGAALAALATVCGTLVNSWQGARLYSVVVRGMQARPTSMNVHYRGARSDR